MSYIVSFILPLLYIIFYTYSLTILFKKIKFEHALPLTLILSAIIMYISLYLFKTIYFGLGLNVGLCLIFPIHLIKNKYSLKEIKKEYLTNGLISFIFIYIVIYLYDLNRYYTRWDELSHWGKMVKEIIRLDNFYSIDASHLLVHKDYPPIFPLMETLYTFISGGFKETYLIRCIHVFEASIILSIFNHDKKVDIKNTVLKTLLVFIFMCLLTFLFDSEVFINSIYTDIPLSFLVGYILFYIFRKNKYDSIFFITISILFIFLLLTKQIGLPLYLVCLLFLVLKLIFNKYKFNIKRILLVILSVIIIPIIFLFSWNNYKHNLGLVGQFETSDIKINELPGIINKTEGEEWQQIASEKYMKALYTENITGSYIKITILSLIIIIPLITAILFVNMKDKIEKKNYVILGISLIVGLIGYLLMMYLLYVFNFGPVESPILASYDRYLSCYILIVLYSLISIFIYYKDINYKYLIILTIVVGALIRPHQYLRLRPDLIVLPNHLYDASKYAAYVIDNHTEVDDKVFILDQQEKNGAVFYVNYFSNKVKTNLVNYELTNIINYKDILKDYNYLYVYSLTTNELELNKLYKIEISNDEVNLIKVG